MNHTKPAKSASGSRDHTSRYTVMKRSGRSAHSDGLPTVPTATREHELQKQIQELQEQLHRQEIQNILDLQVASGLITGKERVESAERLVRIPADGLAMMRRDLVKVLTKLCNVTSSPSPSAGSTLGDGSYIA